MKTVPALLIVFLSMVYSSASIADNLPKVAYFNIPTGRTIESQTAINKLSTSKGVVAVNFVISKKGKVLSALVDAKHTTVTDNAFVKKVLKAVLATKFNISYSAPEKQNGSLAYVFN